MRCKSYGLDEPDHEAIQANLAVERARKVARGEEPLGCRSRYVARGVAEQQALRPVLRCHYPIPPEWEDL